jgi:hypothetical protein
MTTITVPRAVLEQALEALVARGKRGDGSPDTVAALRAALPCTYKCEAWPECACAALAQQEQDTAVHMTHCNQGEWVGVCKYGEEDCPALAQQEQEPVAWRSQNATPPGGFVIFQQYPQALADLGGVIEPLYTAPPRREWKGLKEWEINDGRDQLPTEDLCNWSFRQGVYFAEAKLKEKNQ